MCQLNRPDALDAINLLRIPHGQTPSLMGPSLSATRILPTFAQGKDRSAQVAQQPSLRVGQLEGFEEGVDLRSFHEDFVPTAEAITTRLPAR